jgi:hypothetical protein
MNLLNADKIGDIQLISSTFHIELSGLIRNGMPVPDSEQIRLKPSLAGGVYGMGIFAFLANSTSDPEYHTGTKLEEDYFLIGKVKKRYFSTEFTGELTKGFYRILLDSCGETYKDRAKGVHNLIRFIGFKKFS